MPHLVKLIVVSIVMCQSIVWAAEVKEVFTQKSFVQRMFQHLSWDQGLSKEPADRDYLQILGGKRTFIYEAENAYNENTNRVTVRNFTLYGPFTGKGWLLGVSDTTAVDFAALLPIKGEYVLKAVIKGNGFIWNIVDKQYRSDSKSDVFSEVEIGKIALNAGVLKIQVSIPPEGAIDSFSLSAPDYMPIQPVAGWRFKEPLTAGQLAEIVVSMSGRHEQLQSSENIAPRRLSVFESAVIPPTAARTAIEEFGKFTSREWVRSDYRGASIQVPVKTATAGFYGITANVMGGRISGSVNESQFEVLAKPFFDTVRLGLFRLESGDNLITINLPPMGGIDTLELSMKNISSDSFLAVSGIKGPAGRLISIDEADATIKSVTDSYSVRR